jgi:MarR family transcriptional regulator, organic hydroperoxide resistance regulator
VKKSFDEDDVAELDRIHHILHMKELQGSARDSFPRLRSLSTLEMGILSLLTGKPDAAPAEIADYLRVPRSTVTGALDRLEAKGYLGRAINPEDRRSFRLVLTEEGKLAQGEHLASEREFYLRVLGLLSSREETASFLALARKVAEGL